MKLTITEALAEIKTLQKRIEAVTRVRLMASGVDTWDLSPNDCAALGVVLSEVDRLERDLALAEARLAEQTASIEQQRLEAYAAGARDARSTPPDAGRRK